MRSGDQNQPSPFHPPAAQRRQEIHPEHVEIVIVGDWSADVAARRSPPTSSSSARPRRHADDAVAGADELIALRLTLARRPRCAVSRSIVVMVAPLSTRNLTVWPLTSAIDPEMAVDRHRNARFAALLHRRSDRFGLQPLRDPAEIVAECEQDEAGGEDRDPGQRHGRAASPRLAPRHQRARAPA